MIHDEVQQLTDELISLRRDFHQHPELGTMEYRTAARVEAYLHALGIRTERLFGTGVVGYIEGAQPGKTLLLRADMDALPVEEEVSVAYRSVNQGVMHACGHDGHTAMLLCAAKVLERHRRELRGTIKLVFQPNEENSGACHMVEEGVLKNPTVDASFGIHLHSMLPSGTIGIQAGVALAEMYNFHISLRGKGGHTSSPQESIDPILCAAHVIEAVQMIQSREIGPMDATCIVFGKISGGSATNIIPETVELAGTLRYLYDGDDEGEQHPRKRFTRIVESVCRAHRVACDITFEVSNYVVENDKSCVEFLKEQVFPKLVPVPKVEPFICMGGDDFSEFSNHNHIPGAYMFLGIADHLKGTDYPQHSPKFNIDEDMLTVGTEIFVQTALEYLK